jgi:hypothetical protein
MGESTLKQGREKSYQVTANCKARSNCYVRENTP